MTMPQHVTVLTKTTEHRGQLPNTVGNDFPKSVIFFRIGDEMMDCSVSRRSMMRRRVGVVVIASVAESVS